MLLLSGCTAGSEEPPAPPTPTATSSATSEAEATEPPAEPAQPELDLADTGSWLISFDGIGPVRPGGQISETRPAMTAFVEDELPEWCPAARFQRDGTLELLAHLSDDFATITALSVAGRGDSSVLSQISPRTAEGIGVGATFDELLAAYPAIEKSGEYGGGDDPTLYYAVPNDDGVWIVFSVSDDTVDGIFVRDTPRPPSEYCS